MNPRPLYRLCTLLLPLLPPASAAAAEASVDDYDSTPSKDGNKGRDDE